MRMKLAAASILALGLMTSVSYAQSNPTPNNMAGDKTAGEDAGGGANGDIQNRTGTNEPVVIDPNATNSTMGNTNTTGTVDRSRCPDPVAPGAVATQGGNSGASVSEACPDNSQ
ncbi:hypothetical protein QTL95_18540 [Rhizobium sp. S152]|uniref:hypothetical protein n=1 Tax=Rhizobium sp. S152 TaxID=3055038 RepID=UPI0025A97EDB|nr:hypothetical protein [Rhizobium sp. S152]MDM9627894.1 hypothetical protein [Rhizobium sp. S152]